MSDEISKKGIETVVIAMGSNVPDRMMYLQCGLEGWKSIDGIEVRAVSRIYESPPVGEGLEGDFFNMVIVIGTSLPPESILNKCHEIESGCGRDRQLEANSEFPRNRTLDCDVIFYGDAEIETERLVVPHPRWQDRTFVVMPLNDVIEHLTAHQKGLVKNATKSPNSAPTPCRPIGNMLD
jgi:2-amino-4-hydroxy-6-hydroxymethyldihydropteridine diphosphokinase